MVAIFLPNDRMRRHYEFGFSVCRVLKELALRLNKDVAVFLEAEPINPARV